MLQNFLMWTTLAVIIQVGLDQGEVDNLGVLYLLLIIIFSSIMSVSLAQSSSFRVLKRDVFRNSTIAELMVFCYAYVDLVMQAEDKMTRANFYAAFKNVYRNIQGLNSNLVEEAKKVILCKSKDKEYQKTALRFLVELLEYKSQEFPRSAHIKLMIGYINHEKLNLIWLALYKMNTLEECNPDL